MSTVILPYKMESESGKLLSDKTGWLRIRRENSKYKHRENNIIINWGCNSRPPHIPDNAIVINSFDAVAKATDKVAAFNCFLVNGVSSPSFTTDPDLALSFVRDGQCIIARTILNGHGGAGIVIIENEEDFIEAPLYTKYIRKKSEWRIHVMGGGIIDATRKVLRPDYPNKEAINWKIRNHDNGFIFQRYNSRVLDDDGLPTPEKYLLPNVVEKQAMNAVKALGLDFGAVDVVYNEKYNMAFVLEVNTAPGLADGTAEIYADYFDWTVRREMAEIKNPLPAPDHQF